MSNHLGDDDGQHSQRSWNNQENHHHSLLDETNNINQHDQIAMNGQERNPRPSFLSHGVANSLNDMDSLDGHSVSTIKNDEDKVTSSSFKGHQKSTQLAAQETKAVNRIKILLFIILLVASCGFAVVVYKFTRNEETDTFQETFVVYSQQIEYAVQVSAQNRLEAVGALAFQIQTYVHDNNLTWPFVTLSFFEDRVYSMKTLTDAFGILLFPIVSHKDRQAWEAYSVANCQWVNDSYAFQRIHMGTTDEAFLTADAPTWFDALWGDNYKNYRNPDFSSGIGGRVFGTCWDPNNETIRGPFIYPDRDVYFPQWQVAPMSWYSQSAINQNYAQFDDFANATTISIETGLAVLGIAWTDSEAPGYITTMLYPIYREVYFDKSDASMDVVAFLGVDIDWKDYMTGIFQEDAAGATVVIENNVDQVFTYRITGASVTFLGENDTHDTKYDRMEKSFVFGRHLASDAAVQNSSYTGAHLHPDWVRYTIRIYPSQDLEDNFYSAQPVVYTVVVLFVALIASGTFFLYDLLVERRQKVVLQTAERSDAIVSSLFPKKVKEQLYQTTGGDSSSGKKSSIKPSSAKWNHEQTIENDGHRRDCVMGEQQQSTRSLVPKDDKKMEGAVTRVQTPANRKLEGPPIAELYESATVFFADMVGFTAWSSQRSPADVFTLLETCYGAFDDVAERRGVFKVETIGDCYVAVTGIPFRREDHAVIMAKFARDILNTMSQQLGHLVPILGSSTASLAMRVDNAGYIKKHLDHLIRSGMHSGPVTAGVLRGQRARFQLFGDTVNTAARMESTGLRNRIQLSQATADLLIKAGKEAWIAKRSDEVEAKGKGRMQTFWLQCSVAFPVAHAGTVTTPVSSQ